MDHGATRSRTIAAAAKTVAWNLRKVSADDLRAAAHDVALDRADGEATESLLPRALAVVAESVRRVTGAAVSGDQMFTAAAMCSGVVREAAHHLAVATVMAAFWHSLGGAGVHVVVAGEAQAEHDAVGLAAALGPLGRRVALISDGMSHQQRQAAYRADVIVAPYWTLMDDFLRDNLRELHGGHVPRDECTAVIADGDGILVGRADFRRAIFAPRSQVPPVVPRAGLDAVRRAVDRLRREGGFEVVEGVAIFDHNGLVMLADALGEVEFSPAFLAAADEVRAILAGAGSDEPTVPYVSVSLASYFRRYGRLACAVSSTTGEVVKDLKRMYRLECAQGGTGPSRSRTPRYRMCADGAQRRSLVTCLIASARSRGRSVMIWADDPDHWSDGLDEDGIEHSVVRPGGEISGFGRAGQPGAVTVVGSGVVLPGIIGPASALPAPRVLFVNVSPDASQPTLDWSRLAAATGGDDCRFLVPDDPLISDLPDDLKISMGLHPYRPPSSHSWVPVGVSNRISEHIATLVWADRAWDWLFQTVVERYATKVYALRRGILEATDAGRPAVSLTEDLVVDVSAGRHVNVLRLLGDHWCRLLNAASFLRVHCSLAYPYDGDNPIAAFDQDLRMRFESMLREVHAELGRLAES